MQGFSLRNLVTEDKRLLGENAKHLLLEEEKGTRLISESSDPMDRKQDLCFFLIVEGLGVAVRLYMQWPRVKRDQGSRNRCKLPRAQNLVHMSTGDGRIWTWKVIGLAGLVARRDGFGLLQGGLMAKRTESNLGKCSWGGPTRPTVQPRNCPTSRSGRWQL